MSDTNKPKSAFEQACNHVGQQAQKEFATPEFRDKFLSGIKHDNEKPDMSLLSSIALTKIAEVMSFGKHKYTANNWRGGISYSRLEAAAMRHILAWNGGESLDLESGMSHLAHASCCLMMLLEFETTRPELDDRYVANKVAPGEKGEQLEPPNWKEKACQNIIEAVNAESPPIFFNENLIPQYDNNPFKPYKPKGQP